MFAVSGWSVSADKLKTETANKSSAASAEPAKTRKRKRPHTVVNAANLADAWDKVAREKKLARKAPVAADGKDKATPKQDRQARPDQGQSPANPTGEERPQKSKKRRTTDEGDGDQPLKVSAVSDETGSVSATAKQKAAKKERHEKAKPGAKDDSGPPSQEQQQPDANQAKKIVKPQPAAVAKPAPKLTPLQASMREKLVSARFRHLNETLYTRPSADAFRLFADSPEMFDEYHEGFRRQVEVWPSNPVDGYTETIRARARIRDFSRGRHQNNRRPPPPSGNGGSLAPLPRSLEGTCRIADLGCGDAALAAALQPRAAKLRLDISSFDLQSPSPLVTRADIANLPLGDGSVDVAIFCLALMGTNWLDFVEEAYRVLRWKGELWVAEIKSRFIPPGKKGPGGGRGRGVPVEHSVGNRRKDAQGKSKGRGADGSKEAGPAEMEHLAVEVDGVEDKRQQTDVTAFVEALHKRGFVLKGAGTGGGEAIDLSNKMFVKMEFLKAAPPTKGKGVVVPRVTGAEKTKKRFIAEAEDEERNNLDESAILKPCVYKLR